MPYGAGDLLNDYEGIGGHEAYRPEPTLAYVPTLDADGALASLRGAAMRVRRFRLERASAEDARWLAGRMDREPRRLGMRVELAGDGMLHFEPGA